MERNKIVKKASIVLGVLIVLFLLVNIGINIWLKYALPDYIKNNSQYRVNYSTLNVDIATGNIQASDLKIASKNIENLNVIGLDGTINQLDISRLGIYDALFNKRVNSNELKLVQPKLQVRLAKPIDDKTGKKRNPVAFKNITIEDGNIRILRHTGQKFLAADRLFLEVYNLKLTEEAVENRLPVVFDEYSIRGQNFFFRPDNIYALKAQNITTEKGQMSVEDFKVIPLLTFDQFKRFYPKKPLLFQFNTEKMKFSDIVLKKNRIALSEVNLEQPHLKIFNSGYKNQAAEKPFKFIVDLQNVVMSKARVEVLKPNGSKLLYANSLDLDIDKLLMDEETAKGNIPFSYEKFLINGKDVMYSTDTQSINVQALRMDKSLVNIRNASLKPNVAKSAKAMADLTVSQVQFKLNEWKLEDNKLQLDAESALINGISGSIFLPGKNNGKKADYKGIKFPLKVKNIQLAAPNLKIYQGSDLQNLNNLNLRVNSLEMNEETVKDGVPFKTGSYNVTVKNFSRQLNRFYQLNAGLLKMNNNQLQVNNFALKPLVSRAQFIRMIPAEKDLYDLKAQQITMQGNWDLASDKQFLYADQLNINSLNANIFRSKVPADDTSVKPMYSALLRKIKFPMVIRTVSIKNSILEYEEDTKKSAGPGKLTFGNFNMTIKNLNSGKEQGKPTQIPIDISCRFMNSSPMHVKWTLDTASMSDAFTIRGNISDLPAPHINAFIEPYLKIRATGTINDLLFNFRGNAAGLNGTVNMKHQELKVSLLKQDGEKNKILSAVANVFIKSNSGDYPESVTVDNIKRDATKSFFNLFWNGIQEGLKKTLIGKNVEQTEKSVRNTVKDVKEVTDAVNISTKQDDKKVSSKTDQQTENKQPQKKDGFFKRIFKKKKDSE